MTESRKQLIWRWLVGSFIGTLVIALSSPLFVRSYLPQTHCSVRQVVVPRSGAYYRWRSEGYASTFIGPLGMPGRKEVPPQDSDTIRLAIWGDSQAEGICVDDQSKLHDQVESAGRMLGSKLTAFPLAKSGDDASDWLRQIPDVQKELRIDIHVILVVELNDLVATIDSYGSRVDVPTTFDVADKFPAFMIESARRLLTDPENQPRHLRFSLGPVVFPVPSLNAVQSEYFGRGAINADEKRFARFDVVTDKPIVIVYAPVLPNITDGQVRIEDDDNEKLMRLSSAVSQQGVTIIDARDSLRESVRVGVWPHGFHNGRFGSGHLNASGYRIIADRIVKAVQNIVEQE